MGGDAGPRGTAPCAARRVGAARRRLRGTSLRILLDTHVWIWWLTPAAALPKSERVALDHAASAGDLYLSAISLWEAQMLYAKARLVLPVSFAEWLERAADRGIVTVVPLDVDVVLALDELPSTFHGDPADRLIVATARAHRLPLATHDRAIRRSRAVRLWKP